MGKFSSSQSKRSLILTSLAVSLVLHGGGLYFLFKHPFAFKPKTHQASLTKELDREFVLSETLNKLIIKSESPPHTQMSSSPSFEEKKEKLEIISNLFFPLKMPPQDLSVPDSLPNYVAPFELVKEEKQFHKFSTLEIEKPVNFSQELGVDFEKLAYKKTELEGIKSTSHLPKFELKANLSDVKPQIIMPKSQNIGKILNHKTCLKPTSEIYRKKYYKKESLYFFYEDEFKAPHLSLESPKQVPIDLIPDWHSVPKHQLTSQTSIGRNFFGAIRPLDFSAIADVEQDSVSYPSLERVKSAGFILNINPYSIASFKPPDLALQPETIDLLPQTVVENGLCKAKLTPQLAIGNPLSSHYPKIQSFESQIKQEAYCSLPSLEKDLLYTFRETPMPHIEALPEEVIAFLHTPDKFSLTTAYLSPPKYLFELTPPCLEIPDSYLEKETPIQVEMEPVISPENETVIATPFSHDLPELAGPPDLDDQTVTFAPMNPKQTPLDPPSIETPHASLSPKVSKWKELEYIRPELAPQIDIDDSNVALEPQSEKHSVILESDDALADVRDIDIPEVEIQTFALPPSDPKLTSGAMTAPPLAHLETKEQLDIQDLKRRFTTSMKKNQESYANKIESESKSHPFPERDIGTPSIPKTDISEEPLSDLKIGDIPALAEHENNTQRLIPQEASFNYTSRFLEDPKMLFDKAVLEPLQALKDFPEYESFFSINPKKDSFPLLWDLKGRKALPGPQHSTQNEEGLAANFPETPNIQSGTEKVIEGQHSEKALASDIAVPMTLPELTKRMNEHDIRALNQLERVTEGNLSEIPLPTQLETISYQNDFETTVAYIKKPDQKGYHFAIKIKPSKDLYFASAEQNFIFIIDGSSSIKKHRYNAFKNAVIKSLSYMHEGDSFNILVADSHINAMHEKNLSWSKKAPQYAQKYLNSREFRGFFSKHSAFSLLAKASSYFDSEKENIIILITDGHSFGNIKKHKKELKALTEKSHGNFSLFTASASKNNNLTMLDLVSTFNHGEFMYSPTNASFPRNLAILVKHIESRIAKDLRINTIAEDRHLDLQFYPNQETLPALYSDSPFILYGSIDSLEDFDIILQGRAGEQWINIKQHITFKDAEEAGYQLKRNFALQQAYACYDYYLKKDDPFFLAEAERILNPHALIPATR